MVKWSLQSMATTCRLRIKWGTHVSLRDICMGRKDEAWRLEPRVSPLRSSTMFHFMLVYIPTTVMTDKGDSP